MTSANVSRLLAVLVMVAGLATAYWVFDEAVRPIWQAEPSSDWQTLQDGTLAAGTAAKEAGPDPATEPAKLQTPVLSDEERALPFVEAAPGDPALVPAPEGGVVEGQVGGTAAGAPLGSAVSSPEGASSPPRIGSTESAPAAAPEMLVNPLGAGADVPVRAPVIIKGAVE